MNAWSYEVARPEPLLTLGVLAATVLVPPLMLFTEYELWWTPLQSEYILTYLLTACGGRGPYRSLRVSSSKGSALAVDSDVVPAAPTTRIRPERRVPFVLSDLARCAGARSLEWEWFPWGDNAEIHEWLRQRIYDGQSLWELVKVPLGKGAFFLVVLLPFAGWGDWKRRRQMQEGYFVHGAQLVTRSRFNRAQHSDGLGFATANRSFWERVRRYPPERCRVQIPKHQESEHILLMGDSGTDKDSLIRQILLEIQRRADTAIVLDPTLAFTPQFYDPARGDQILNPLDRRMPYWSPTNEVHYAPEALILAESLFPQPPTDDSFCVQIAQQIFERLLRFRPSLEELTRWLSHGEEVDRLVAGTELARLIERATTLQRVSIQCAFARVASALKLLPAEDQAQGRYSAAEWVRERRGWLFLTSMPLLAKQILLLTSVWLDSLLVGLMTSMEGGAHTVWIFLHDLGLLQKLPNLGRGITSGRNCNFRLVLGASGRNQIEVLYGREWQTIMQVAITASHVFFSSVLPRFLLFWICFDRGELKSRSWI